MYIYIFIYACIHIKTNVYMATVTDGLSSAHIILGVCIIVSCNIMYIYILGVCIIVSCSIMYIYIYTHIYEYI